jgi:rod shape-determining protein MreC
VRNLFLLLWKYQYFILFLLFEIISGYLIIRGNDFQNASVVNSANQVSATVLGAVNQVTQYIGLTSENKKLAEENAMLRSLLPGAYYDDNMRMETVHDSTLRQRYQYIEARVINNSTGRRNNYLTLTAGGNKGIKPGMSVVSPQGIAGIVKDVSENFCTVISLLHKDFKTSARLKQNNYFGNLEWRGGSARYAHLNDLPKHVIIHEGDTLVTTAFSSVFPEGIMVGTVESFELAEGENFYDVKVKLATDFGSLNYVYVINDMFREELIQLESQQKND